MNCCKKLRKIFFATVLIFEVFLYNNYLFADAWTQKKSGALFISSFYGSQFNSTNHLTGGANIGDIITSTNFITYSEYGITDKLTFGTNADFVDYMKINHFKIQNQNFGMSFVKIFSRYRIFSRKNFVGSVVFGYQAPGIYNGNLYPQEFAQKSNGIITRVEIGYSFKDSNANLQIYNTASDFLTFAFEYKRNIGLNYAETIFDFTFGHFLQNDILLLLKLQKISYIVNNVNNVVSRNNNLFDPFANNGIFKVGFSFVMNVSKNINIEAGYCHSIAASFLHTSFKPLNLNSIFVGIWLHD